MTAVNTAERFAQLMSVAANGAPSARDSMDCEARSWAAQKVAWHLDDVGYWGGLPPTREEAIKEARRAWGDDIPSDIAEALGFSA